ncbi:MAG: hypothetical protein SNJ78_08920 [Spirochaetales bacterium]
MKSTTQEGTNNLSRFLKLAFTLCIVALLFSCDLFLPKGVTIEERIDMFMKDVNAGRYDKLYTHFHPDLTQQRQQLASPDIWTPVPFEPNQQYSYKITLKLTDVVTVTVTGGLLYANGMPFIFEMEKSGDDYYIRTLTIGTTNYGESQFLRK